MREVAFTKKLGDQYNQYHSNVLIVLVLFRRKMYCLHLASFSWFMIVAN